MRWRSRSKRHLGLADRVQGQLCCALLLSALGGVGCVGLSTHGEVVSERDALAEKLRLLEASNASLSDERVKLLESLEDTREERTALDRSVRRLRKQEAELARSLNAREAELAKQNTEVSRLRDTYTALVDDLESELAAGQIEIHELREGLRVNISDAILFSSGSAQIGSEGAAILLKVAGQLAKLTYSIEVGGHTDNIPITGALARRYPSTWELAGARAASVVRLFERAGVARSRLVVVSHASTRPVASNDTPEDRSRNRRIEIHLKPTTAGPAVGTQQTQEKPASAS
jgi:chemotaxis protein MotB